MIAKSDLIILTLATSALVLGVVRWQYNIRPNEAITVPASVRLAPPATASSQQPLQSAQRQPAQDNAKRPVAATDSQGAAPRTAPRAAMTQPASPAPEIQVSSVSEPAPEAADSGRPDLGVHVVTRGEHLSLIAQKYDTTVKALAALNEIEGDTIYVGQKIRYPQAN